MKSVFSTFSNGSRNNTEALTANRPRGPGRLMVCRRTSIRLTTRSGRSVLRPLGHSLRQLVAQRQQP